MSLDDGVLEAVVTVTDGDLDVDTASVDIGDQVQFSDDGPTAAIKVAQTDIGDGEPELVDNTVTIDESAGEQDDDDNADTAATDEVSDLFASLTGVSSDLDTAQFAQSGAALVDISDSDFGADDEDGTEVISLNVVGFIPAVEGDEPEDAVGVDSGLSTTDGDAIYLFEEDGLVVGRIGDNDSSGTIAFAIVINADTGVVSVAQYASITNDVFPDDHDDIMSLDDGVLEAVVTVTDGDLDVDTASVDIGDQVQFSDDGPTAVDDSALVLPEGGASVGGDVLTNDLLGADGATVTHISLDGGDTWMLITDGSPLGDGSYEFIVADVGTYTFSADGNWSFTSVAEVSGNVDASFKYLITDGDGDTSTALQPILVTDVTPSTAFIVVNTSNTGGGGASGQQSFEVILTNGDATLAKQATLEDEQGQQGIALTFDDADVVFLDGQTYTVILDHMSGSAHVNVTNFAITDSNGNVIEFNGKGGSNNTTLIGNPDGTEDESTSFDGVIYTVEGAVAVEDINVSDPIGYDVNTVDGDKVLVLDSALDNKTDFTLDFSDLPINGGSETDLFGIVDEVNISGSGGVSEDNTITLSAQDVFDLGAGSDHTLFVTGDDGDAVQTSDTWVDGGTINVEGVNYDTFTAIVDTNTVTLNVEQDVLSTGVTT